MGDSEPPDIFRHQSTGYLRTGEQETLYEACACVIHTNLQLHVHYCYLLHLKIREQSLDYCEHVAVRVQQQGRGSEGVEGSVLQ